MEEARLGPLSMNLWFAVFDFNDDAKTGENWRLLSVDEEDPVWSPLTSNSEAMSESTIPRVEAGSIPVPSEEEAKAAGGMQSFSLGTTQEEAQKAMEEQQVEEEGEDVDSFEEESVKSEDEVQETPGTTTPQVEQQENTSSVETPTVVNGADDDDVKSDSFEEDDNSFDEDSEQIEISDEEIEEIVDDEVKSASPVKATPAAFTASDGTGFDDRSAYRKYEFELSYTFKKKSGVPGMLSEHRKEPGAIAGQPFEIADCNHCKLMVLDHTEAVQIDYVDNSKVFLGACCDSVFVRNCTNCTFTIACKQVVYI